MWRLLSPEGTLDPPGNLGGQRAPPAKDLTEVRRVDTDDRRKPVNGDLLPRNLGPQLGGRISNRRNRRHGNRLPDESSGLSALNPTIHEAIHSEQLGIYWRVPGCNPFPW